MTTISWNGEGGTEGSTITTANSGGASGTPFTNVTGTCTYTSVGKGHGSLGLRYNLSATNWRSYHTFTATSQIAGRFYFMMNALSPTSLTLFTVINTAFNQTAYFVCNASRKFVVQGTGAAVVLTGTTSLVAGTLYRVEFEIDVGTTTANGTINARLYAGDSTTPLDSVSNTACNAGAGVQVIRCQVGNNEAATVDTTYDDLFYVTDSMAPVGPTLPAPAGTANVYSVTDNSAGWTNEGGAPDIRTALSDANDTTFIQSLADPANSTVTLRLAPLTKPPGVITVRAQADADTQTVRIELLQGGTVRASTTALVLSTGWANYSLSLTAPERAAIVTAGDGSVSDLDVRLTANTP